TTLGQKVMANIQQRTETNVSELKKNKQKMVSKKEPAGKAKRIKLFPIQEQRQTLVKWFGTTRWTYNQALLAVEKDRIPRNKKSLRVKCVNSELFQNEN
ncbi:3992_t:CDS:1, partial [Racocetra fulgida]